MSASKLMKITEILKIFYFYLSVVFFPKAIKPEKLRKDHVQYAMLSFFDSKFSITVICVIFFTIYDLINRIKVYLVKTNLNAKE